MMKVWQDGVMSSCHCTTTDNHYPLKAATTQRFRMGAPRSFVVSGSGNKVAFVRSDSGSSAVLNIWIVENLDTQPQERCVVRASDLLKDDETLSPAERARRERL
ncbi:MAG: Dipeptidyl aminopeptidase 4, partial [Actinomycetota bacterium]